jgi:hypothetical protein
LEEIIKPSQITTFDKEKSDFLAVRGEYYKQGQSIVRKALVNRIIRFANDFIIIANEESEIAKLKDKLKEFLERRGLVINKEKSSLMK